MKFYNDIGDMIPRRAGIDSAYVASGGGAAGDPVKLVAANGKVAVCAATDVQAIGWAAEAFVDGGPVTVVIGYEAISADMPITGTYAAGMEGKAFGLAGTTGAFTVDTTNTTQLIFKFQSWNPVTNLARVSILPAAFQYGGKVPA